MTNKEWLSRAFHKEKYIRELKSAYNTAFENAVYTSPDFQEKVQTSQNNTTQTKLTQCTSLTEKLETYLIEQYRMIEEITVAICEIQDDRYRAVLIARYINFKRVHTIAKEQNYSVDHIKRLLRAGEDLIKR